MGRHAHPSSRHFWASFALASLRAAGGLVLVAAAFALVASIDRDPADGDGPAMLGAPGDDVIAFDPADAGSSGTPATDASTREFSFAPPVEPAPADRSDEPGEQQAAGHEVATDVADAAPDPAGTSVQVLGPGTTAQLQRVAAALAELGYVVVATNPAQADGPATTVLYSAGHEAAARALQAREPRIAVVAPNTGFSEDVDLHVIVGADWGP